MIPLTPEEAKARYQRTETATDEMGRQITVGRLRPSQQSRIVEMTPGLDGNISATGPKGEVVSVPYRLQMIIAASVRKIDDAVFPFPRTRSELDSVLDLLDNEGMAAASEAYGKLFPKDDEENPSDPKEAAKNSQRTRS